MSTIVGSPQDARLLVEEDVREVRAAASLGEVIR